MALKIKELPKSERPYEKVEGKGTEALTDADLIAVILGSGTRDESVTDMAKRLMAVFERTDGLSSLYNKSLEELKCIKGIGRVKAIRLKAVAELSKRMNSRKSGFEKIRIYGAKDISDMYMEEMRRHDREIFKVVLLNTRNAVMRSHDVSIGTVNSSLFNSSMAFKEAVRSACASVVFLHNHPSGDPSPSIQDIECTKELVKSGKILGINVLDHIIIGDGTFVSMKNYGLL